MSRHVPGRLPVSAAEELARVLPVIRAVADELDVVISIDTSKAEVARQALAAGAHIVNDITALRGDAEMVSVVAADGCWADPDAHERHAAYDATGTNV